MKMITRAFTALDNHPMSLFFGLAAAIGALMVTQFPEAQALSWTMGKYFFGLLAYVTVLELLRSN